MSGDENTPRCTWVAAAPTTTAANDDAPVTTAPAASHVVCDAAAAQQQQQQQQRAMLAALDVAAKGVAASLAGMLDSVKGLDLDAAGLQKELGALNAAIAAEGC